MQIIISVILSAIVSVIIMIVFLRSAVNIMTDHLTEVEDRIDKKLKLEQWLKNNSSDK